VQCPVSWYMEVTRAGQAGTWAQGMAATEALDLSTSAAMCSTPTALHTHGEQQLFM
jgi:hypothetical protein